ncbi:MAG: TasA family protein, partial [Petrotogales bacterium]
MNKQLLMSVMAIGAAALMLGAGTLAYFSDLEVAKNNTFTAGIIDISLDPAGGQD